MCPIGRTALRPEVNSERQPSGKGLRHWTVTADRATARFAKPVCAESTMVFSVTRVKRVDQLPDVRRRIVLRKRCFIA